MLTHYDTESLLDALLDPVDKNGVLIEMYSHQRDKGATPHLCGVFMSRIENLLGELARSGCSSTALLKLRDIEHDLGDMGYFDEDIRELRKCINSRKALLNASTD